MKVDLYTKAVLTVIAAALVCLVFQNFYIVSPAYAEKLSANTISCLNAYGYQNVVLSTHTLNENWDPIPVFIVDNALEKRREEEIRREEAKKLEEEIERNRYYISDTIKLKPDTVCLNMNPFTFKTGLLLTHVGCEKRLSDNASSGVIVSLVFDFKKISSSDFNNGKIKLLWKVKDEKTGIVQESGINYISLEKVKASDDKYKAKVDIAEIDNLSDKKNWFLTELNDVPVEECLLQP